ncbi:hypothetical protein LP415_05630 [Polaromonas sp. P1(28)-8]|nr:hypothetical protein LP415_05630 [Polaromonas sp. P1(28)-8]
MTHKIRLFVLAAAVAIFAVSCASTTLQRKNFKSYSVGSVATATIGETFLVDQNGSVETVKSWVGIFNSPDGWKIEDRYSHGFSQEGAYLFWEIWNHH